MIDRTLAASKITLWAGVLTGWIGALTLSEWAILLGMIGTAVGIVCTVFLTWKRNYREQKEFEMRTAALEVERRKQLRRKSDAVPHERNR